MIHHHYFAQMNRLEIQPGFWPDEPIPDELILGPAEKEIISYLEIIFARPTWEPILTLDELDRRFTPSDQDRFFANLKSRIKRTTDPESAAELSTQIAAKVRKSKSAGLSRLFQQSLIGVDTCTSFKLYTEGQGLVGVNPNDSYSKIVDRMSGYLDDLLSGARQTRLLRKAHTAPATRAIISKFSKAPEHYSNIVDLLDQNARGKARIWWVELKKMSQDMKSLGAANFASIIYYNRDRSPQLRDRFDPLAGVVDKDSLRPVGDLEKKLTGFETSLRRK